MWDFSQMRRNSTTWMLLCPRFLWSACRILQVWVVLLVVKKVVLKGVLFDAVVWCVCNMWGSGTGEHRNYILQVCWFRMWWGNQMVFQDFHLISTSYFRWMKTHRGGVQHQAQAEAHFAEHQGRRSAPHRFFIGCWLRLLPTLMTSFPRKWWILLRISSKIYQNILGFPFPASQGESSILKDVHVFFLQCSH